MNKNICLTTDSYKLNHWNQYPKGTEKVYSYFECRKGSKFAETPFFGLQYIIKNHLEGVVVTRQKIENAAKVCKAHFGDEKYFNREGWEYILNNYEGKLPVVIKAVEEGTVVPINNVLMTIENTGGEKTAWLTNFLETILSQVWYPITVAALSREVKVNIKEYLDLTSDGGLLNFGLHDFGFRGASSWESAGIGGAAHLINFLGTDTVVAMEVAMNYYNANLDGLAYSVAATEHSVMTACIVFGITLVALLTARVIVLSIQRFVFFGVTELILKESRRFCMLLPRLDLQLRTLLVLVWVVDCCRRLTVILSVVLLSVVLSIVMVSGMTFRRIPRMFPRFLRRVFSS